MSELPQIDPAKLYQKALAQVNSLSDQAMQMDTLIETLVAELDTVKKERDDLRLELQKMLSLTENENLQNSNEEEKALET